MKKKEILISWVVLGLLIANIMVAIFALPREAKADVPLARVLVIPDDGYTNPYVIFFDQETGDMYHATTGAVDTTWGNCDVVAAKHASNKGVWILTTPALPIGKRIGCNLFDAASAANTDTVQKSIKYDSDSGLTYTDSAPTLQGRVLIRSAY